jgi:hypothetical protein
VAQEKEKKSGPPKRPPLVVVKQAEIRGRVFFLADGEKEEAPGAGLKVLVQSIKDKKTLHQTASDGEGRFVLPSLQMGDYALTVGRLAMELQVKDPDQIAQGARKMPKTLLVFIPRGLGEAGEGQP